MPPEIVETAWHDPAPDEIVVKNLYAGVNATDINVTAGTYTPGTEPPIDLGLDILGEVVAVGENVSHLPIGSHIIALNLGIGYREYSTHQANFVFPVPSADPIYVSVLLSGLTAAFGLYPCGEMKKSDTVLVTAAAGGTGQYAVQLAKLEGLSCDWHV